jgi:hypothetical protein
MCILRRTETIVRAEEDLRRALLISMVGGDGSGYAVEVSEALALRFNLNADALDLRRAAPNIYIAILPN